MSKQAVDLYVDPACPWCWLTANWLFEVERVRPVTVCTRLFSLAEVNKANEEARDTFVPLVRALRVLVGARRAGGEPALRAAYIALGEAHHEQGLSLGDDATVQGALQAAGLDVAIAELAMADGSTLTELLDEHRSITDRGAFGVPTLAVDGSAPFFGPVIDRRIEGEEAGEVWDIVAPVLTDARIFELKRERTGKPGVGRHRADLAVTR